MNKQIKFSEIRKGDRIRVTKIFLEHKGRQDTSIFTGIADHRDEDSDWCTEEGSFLTIHEGSIEETYDLLDRPSPPLPTTPGTVFRATEIYGIKCDTTVMVVDRASSGDYVSANRVDGRIFHDPEHITAWEPINEPTEAK